MAVVSKTTAKSYFEKGDRPTEAEFSDTIDSYVQHPDATGYVEVLSTASSIARPGEVLTAIATAAQGGKTGLIEVLATADVTARPVGAVGLEILSAIVTASAQGHLGGGTVGRQVFEAITTASAQAHLDIVSVVTATETVFGIVEIATQAEMEAAAATDRAATPARVQNHPGVAKAWVHFDGTGTVTIRADYNVDSITDNGTGNYTINFTNDFADANYAYTFGWRRGTANISSFDGPMAILNDTQTVSALQVRAISVNAGAGPVATDLEDVCVAFFGDQ